MRAGWRLLALVAGVAAGVWLWSTLFPHPEKVIRARLSEIADLMSFPANEPPLAAMTEVQQLCARLSPDIEVRVDAPGFGRHTLQGRDRIREAALQFRSAVNGAHVRFPDIRINLHPDRRAAEVFVTVAARLPSEPDPVVQEMRLEMRKLGGDWRLARAETVRPLR